MSAKTCRGLVIAVRPSFDDSRTAHSRPCPHPHRTSGPYVRRRLRRTHRTIGASIEHRRGARHRRGAERRRGTCLRCRPRARLRPKHRSESGLPRVHRRQRRIRLLGRRPPMHFEAAQPRLHESADHHCMHVRARHLELSQNRTASVSTAPDLPSSGHDSPRRVVQRAAHFELSLGYARLWMHRRSDRVLAVSMFPRPVGLSEADSDLMHRRVAASGHLPRSRDPHGGSALLRKRAFLQRQPDTMRRRDFF
jgi:hypothetical protein